MKIVCNGKIYDTEKMEKIAGPMGSAFTSFHLYKSKLTEKFFEFAKPAFGHWIVEELTTKKAQRWCEHYNIDVEIQRKYFNLEVVE